MTIINPITNNKFKCKECNLPLHIRYVDYIGVTKLPSVLYRLMVSCNKNHKKEFHLRERDGEWLANRMFEPLHYGNVRQGKKKGTHCFKSTFHSIPHNFFTRYRRQFSSKQEIDDDLPSIFHKYHILDYQKLMRLSNEYYKHINS